MKKTLTIFSLVLAVVFLAGCGKKTEQSNNENKNQPAVENKGVEQGGVVNSIKEAMGLGKKMKCTYSLDMGGKSLLTEMYVDGKNHKSITTIDGEKNYSVFDGDMIYTWSEKDKKGTKMSMKCIEDLKTQTEEVPSVAKDLKTKPDDFADASNVSCEPVGSVDLSIPSDVEFADNCEMLKKSLEMMNQYKNQIPTQDPNQIPFSAFPEGPNAQ